MSALRQRISNRNYFGNTVVLKSSKNQGVLMQLLNTHQAPTDIPA